MQESWVQSLGWEDPLEKGLATHSSILAGEFHGQRNLAGYSPRSCKESDATERLTHRQYTNSLTNLIHHRWQVFTSPPCILTQKGASVWHRYVVVTFLKKSAPKSNCGCTVGVHRNSSFLCYRALGFQMSAINICASCSVWFHHVTKTTTYCHL